jgi:hypothetical protein
VAVLLACHIWTGLFPERVREHLSPFSAAFAGAYYMLLIGYMVAHVG